MNTKATTKPLNEGAPVMDLAADLSPALKALEAAYRLIQKAYPDAPNVTIVIKRDERAWGHTTVAKVWAPAGVEQADRFEIMVSGENLRRGAEAVAATLIHETAHARNLAAGVLDTDVNGRHNRRFADAAEAMGLTVTQVGWHGWTGTTLSDEGAKRWARMIKVVAAGLAKSAATSTPSLDHLPTPEAPAGTPVTVTPGTPVLVPPRKRGNRNLIKATCDCGDSIRASKGVLDRCAPTCEVCGQQFLPDA